MPSATEDEDAAREHLERLERERWALDGKVAAARAIVFACRRRKEEEEGRAKKEKKGRAKKEEKEPANESKTEEAEEESEDSEISEELEDEEERRRRTAEERERKIAGRNARGIRAEWRGLADPSHVAASFHSEVTDVAVGGTSVLFLYEDGDYGYTSGLPPALHALLHARPADAPPPDYIALGSQKRYYVRFADGIAVWEGPQQMTEELRNTSRTVATVAFGKTADAYFIVYGDGECIGDGLPGGLIARLRSLHAVADLAAVSLGPAGEWMMRARDGRMWWGGLSLGLSATVIRHGDAITGAWFGDDGSYFIRYR